MKNIKLKQILLPCLLSVCFCLLAISGCKEKTPIKKKQRKSFAKKEGFSKMRAYVITENKLYSVNLKKNVIDKTESFPHLRDIFLSRDTVWLAGDSLCWLTDNGIEFRDWLPINHKKVIKRENKFYVLAGNEILELPSERTITLPELPTKFMVCYGRIWVLDQGGLSIYKTSNFKEEHRIPAESPLDFALSEYGLRVYIGRFNCLDIFDTQSGDCVTSIPIKGISRALKFEYLGNKLYCLTESNLYVINRMTNRIERSLEISNGKSIWFSRKGEYGAVLRDSIISFFDASTDKIIKSLKLKVSDITTSLGDSRVYCLTSKEMITINPAKFEALGRIKLDKGKKIIIK